MQIEFRCEGIPFYGDISELREDGSMALFEESLYVMYDGAWHELEIFTENDSTTPQGGREFDYVWYGQGDPITRERVFDWREYLPKNSDYGPISISKETMEEVL